MWSDTLQLDNRTDGSTVAVIFSGTTRESDDPFARASSHLSQIVRHLTRLDYGISRYDGDLFFYHSKFNPCGQEVGASSPPWGLSLFLSLCCPLPFFFVALLYPFPPLGLLVFTG